MNLEEFLAHLSKTPDHGFYWRLNDDGCIRAERRDRGFGPITHSSFCPITAVIYDLKKVKVPIYEVAWNQCALELESPDITDIMIASDTLAETRPYISHLRLRMLRAVGLVKLAY